MELRVRLCHSTEERCEDAGFDIPATILVGRLRITNHHEVGIPPSRSPAGS
jgi:hypothetical protein